MARKFMFITLIAVLLGPLAALADDDNGRFNLFGDARNLTGGLPPDGSIHLTSHCNPYDPVGNPAPCGFVATFSGIDYKGKKHLTFGAIEQLSADFNVDGGDCGGGSPRFQINIDTDGDGNSNGNIFVYFGPSPNFTSCALGWQNTGNLIGTTDAGRWDSTPLGGPLGTYAQTLAFLGAGARVVGIQVVVDGGWTTQRGQAVDVDNFQVNHDVLKSGVRPGGDN